MVLGGLNSCAAVAAWGGGATRVPWIGCDGGDGPRWLLVNIGQYANRLGSTGSSGKSFDIEGSEGVTATSRGQNYWPILANCRNSPRVPAGTAPRCRLVHRVA